MPSITQTYDMSASCQHITDDAFLNQHSATVTVHSCLADLMLWPVLRDHKCNGVTLAPSGLYGDMAATVAKHVWSKLYPERALPGLNVADKHVTKTYICDNPQVGPGQWLEMKAVAEDLDVSGIIKCSFSSIQPDGTKLDDLARCVVKLEHESDWMAEWALLHPLITARIQTLQARAQVEASGKVRTIQRDQAYELFKSFVEYSGKYQAMSEVIIDKASLEATALLDIQAGPEHDLVGPYYLDGICHLSGFVCNATDENAKNHTYISHGWESARILHSFDPRSGKELRNYVCMEPEGKDVLCGTVYVLQDGETVAVWEGVRFKRIPWRVLNVFLPPAKS